jgi:L-2-aminoadipate reductase
MGQLLSTEATTMIPSLQNAFFVGDVLTKRDCLRLQSLASNVRIINMYGTTETQRAVSYFSIPPVSQDPVFLNGQKDIIPAGRGMTDVQLLVINRTDRNIVCGVGELGELFVRAAGLAEGYLQLPDLTEQKFVRNWMTKPPEECELEKKAWTTYYQGARDRLYRTGDLGRYLPNGDGNHFLSILMVVECAGRADDQVKIRGFRIELGEIDTYLSQHPLVRENVTLVRRDKDEEPTLVSYIVPQQGRGLTELLSDEDDGLGQLDDEMVKGLRKYRKLIRDIRDHLKGKLPSYAVPTGISASE